MFNHKTIAWYRRLNRALDPVTKEMLRACFARRLQIRERLADLHRRHKDVSVEMGRLRVESLSDIEAYVELAVKERAKYALQREIDRLDSEERAIEQTRLRFVVDPEQDGQ